MSVCEMRVAGRQARLEFSRDDFMRRYPRLTAHMICESLGYFTPEKAANALAYYDAGEVFCCEWYSHIARGYDKDKLREVGLSVITAAFARRHHHKGYMGDYEQAKECVRRALVGRGPVLASWF